MAASLKIAEELPTLAELENNGIVSEGLEKFLGILCQLDDPSPRQNQQSSQHGVPAGEHTTRRLSAPSAFPALEAKYKIDELFHGLLRQLFDANAGLASIMRTMEEMRRSQGDARRIETPERREAVQDMMRNLSDVATIIEKLSVALRKLARIQKDIEDALAMPSA